MKDIVHVVFQIAGHESWSEPRTGLVVGCDSLLPRTGPSDTSGPHNPGARVWHKRT